MEGVKQKGLSSAALKTLAVVTMLIDHIGAVILLRLLIQNGIYEATVSEEALTVFLQQNATLYLTYSVLRTIGRLAFPVYCFLIVEGFQRTSNNRKYLLRLGLFALLSEVPFDLALSGRAWNPAYQNVFFTLFLGLFVITILRDIELRFPPREKWYAYVPLAVLAVGVGCLLATWLRTDYSYRGVLAIVVLYLFRNRKQVQMWTGAVTFLLMGTSEMAAALAFLPISRYNGTRGRQNKYFFYFFYPVHLLVLWLICMAMGIAWISTL